MLFNSADFLIFFPIVFAFYLVIPRKLRAVWLLVSSYYFYMCWNAKYIVLILFTTIVTYAAALGVERMRRWAKVWLTAAIISNLILLFIFKYADFALENVNAVLNLVHLQALDNPFDVVLPVGISFYTFQTFSYVIDVYRGRTKAEHNLIYYALFASYFPQLVAGPIERSDHLLRQLRTLPDRKLVSFEKASSGFAMMLWGLFMKMVIADRISIFVDGVWDNLFACGTVETVLAAAGFAVQIYCDFGGYSAIAIGASRIMGIELMENFNTPYFSKSISEFWRRWHISLSSWLRDYIYIPLGGNRCSRLRRYLNIMITFFLSGLWHGASWTYIFWGVLHGAYQVIGDVLRPLRNRIYGLEDATLVRGGEGSPASAETAQAPGAESRRSASAPLLPVNHRAFSYRLGQTAFTFLLTTFAWIFFRAETMADAAYYLNRMVTRFNPWVLFNDEIYAFGLDEKECAIFFMALLLLLTVDLIRYVKKMDFGTFLYTQNMVFRWLVMLFLIAALLVYGEYGITFSSAQFIYFAF